MTTILLVENNRMLRTMYTAGLRGYGYDVRETQTTEDALRLLEEGLQPDVLLCDWKLPDGSAETLITAAQGRMPSRQMRVIITTGQPDKVTYPVDHLLPRRAHITDILAVL